MSKNDNMTIGELIKYFRKEKGLTQEELANGICTTRQLINIERCQSIPTLDIIVKFSEKIGINLYEAYSDINMHNGLFAHMRYLKLDRAISDKDIDKIKNCIEENENTDGFLYGKPKQLILHAKSILAINEERYDEAIGYIDEGLRINHNDICISSSEKYSENDIAQIILLGVCKCKKGNRKEGKKVFEWLEKYIKNEVINYHINERKRPLWINMWCSTILNEFFFSNDCEKNNLLNKINEAIDYQIRSGRIYRIIELYLCKVEILTKMKKKDEAKKIYNIAKTIASVYYEPDRFINEKKSILSDNIIEFVER